MTTPYTLFTKQKISELTEIIKKLSQRQCDIQSEKSKAQSSEEKYALNIERTANKSIIRCAMWIKMTLEGVKLGCKLLIDPHFLEWFRNPKGFYIYEFAAKLFNLNEEEYKYKECYYGTDVTYYRYFSQQTIYNHIYKLLFPKNNSGVFGIKSNEDVESNIWREVFETLKEKEWLEFKEIKNY